MKKISQDEFEGLKFKPRGKELHPIIQQILFLDLNQGVVLANNEWPLKQQPSAYFIKNADKFNGMFFRARKLVDGGFAIMRIS